MRENWDSIIRTGGRRLTDSYCSRFSPPSYALQHQSTVGIVYEVPVNTELSWGYGYQVIGLILTSIPWFIFSSSSFSVVCSNIGHGGVLDELFFTALPLVTHIISKNSIFSPLIIA